MSSSYTVTGDSGQVAVDRDWIIRCTFWSITETPGDTVEWADSDSSGYKWRAVGAYSASFVVKGKYDRFHDVWDWFKMGDVARVDLYLDSTTSYYAWLFPRAVCTEFSMEVDIDTGAVIGWSSNWLSDGPYYPPVSIASGDIFNLPTTVNRLYARRSSDNPAPVDSKYCS